jgi:dTDP-4-amino-4,6-dideoxygalactose transaminase
VIEAGAQATGADFFFSDGNIKKACTIGIAGTTSFFPSKNLGCYGDGGAMFTDDDYLARKLRSIANHGMKIRYHYNDIGINSRLDTIQAAILRVKLKYLDQYNRSRREAATDMIKLCPMRQDSIPAECPIITYLHQYTIRIKNGMRDELKKNLRKENTSMVKTRPTAHSGAYHYLDTGIMISPLLQLFARKCSLCKAP